MNLSNQTSFNDEVIDLYCVLEYSTTLRVLDLSNDADVTITAWVTFSALLWNRNAALTKLGFRENKTNGPHDSICRNIDYQQKLKELGRLA